ncbi:hypothetical protein [Methylocaldum sp.]|uniref:hypothetical protein n=1 Tax=Methylocaldum sp. TaxID=1969727 RepID=UPI002D6C1E5D|nr:hypothetical protein [Methylocaldum sp.]HYE38177.1 hypothetical protein [Methylocaldum sp.]
MSTQPLTLMNWKTDPAFVQFLQFDFDFNFASPEAKRQVMTLLPLAVGDNRMHGAIANAVLKEALDLWNRPRERHFFVRENMRWRYIGIERSMHLIPVKAQYRVGRLRRRLSPGSFCQQPSHEVIA